MPRKRNQGLEYFPLDVNVFEDPKLEALHYRFGPIGVMVYIHILVLVYKNGYYIEMSLDELTLAIHRRIGPKWIKFQRVYDMILGCAKQSLIHQDLMLQGVITSKSIQEQFIMSTQKRHNIDTDKYWLLDQQLKLKNGVLLSMPKNAEKPPKFEENRPKNDDFTNLGTQSKSKSKRKKDKEDKLDKSVYGEPKTHFLTNLIFKNNLETNEGFILKYNEMLEEVIEMFGYDAALSGVNYLIKYFRHTQEQIDDPYNYIKASLHKNLEDLVKRNERGKLSIEDMFKDLIQKMD